jgi:hypothetical protein
MLVYRRVTIENGRSSIKMVAETFKTVGFFQSHPLKIWVWVNTYRYIFSGMNIHLPAILMFTRGTRF